MRKPEVGQSLEPPSAQIKDLTLDSLWSTMFIESERGTENPFQVSPCATGWPVRVDFSSTDDQQEKELRF